ncbi:MAG: VWA-like domain-containing protein, partial [Bacteroidales bacterium]|nr:VWA-like domain-containing protein [Bacteroidales bacterium]
MEEVVSERISKIIYDNWFLSEPALHSVLCSHELLENPKMPIAVRCGRGKIEYNPKIIKTLNNNNLEESFRAEVIRIMLKHPYQRQPECPAVVKTTASNIVLSNNYDFKSLMLDKATDFQLPDTEYFEWYCAKLMSGGSWSADGSSADADADESRRAACTPKGKNGQDVRTPNMSKSSLSELWEENDFECSRVNQIIENTTSWGTLPGDLVEKIKATLKAQIDYRKVLSGFRASVISSRRNLTRMRPNRRTDFQNLGSVYKMRTNLLVAVDVSGSISTKMLQKFYSVINRFFKYGIESIDTVQFDTQLGEIFPLKKAKTDIKIKGRGGTDFQPVFDYFR